MNLQLVENENISDSGHKYKKTGFGLMGDTRTTPNVAQPQRNGQAHGNTGYKESCDGPTTDGTSIRSKRIC